MKKARILVAAIITTFALSLTACTSPTGVDEDHTIGSGNHTIGSGN